MLLSLFPLYRRVNYPYIYIHPFFGFPSHLGHHSAPSSCAIKKILYIVVYIYVNPNIPIHPTPFPSIVILSAWGPQFLQ